MFRVTLEIEKKNTVLYIIGWERTVHVSRCPTLYSGRIFVPLCRELLFKAEFHETD